jgi:hypothetical protein
MLANKLVSTFVESGGMYENGCLSSITREKLLRRNVDGINFFEEAKYEVANDISMNSTLRDIVERFAQSNSSDPSSHPEKSKKLSSKEQLD